MALLGGWTAKFSKNFPQKMASVSTEQIGVLGASYDVIAYLGYQPVNGTNHALLAEQTVMNGKDTKNAVMLVYNEKPASMDVSLVSIRTISESGGDMGGMRINVSLDIPEEAKAAFDAAIEGWTGTNIKPVAFLGSQLVNGTNYEMIAEVSPVVPNPKTELYVITVNNLYKNISFRRLFDTAVEEIRAQEAQKVAPEAVLGYSFPWCR